MFFTGFLAAWRTPFLPTLPCASPAHYLLLPHRHLCANPPTLPLYPLPVHYLGHLLTFLPLTTMPCADSHHIPCWLIYPVYGLLPPTWLFPWTRYLQLPGVFPPPPHDMPRHLPRTTTFYYTRATSQPYLYPITFTHLYPFYIAGWDHYLHAKVPDPRFFCPHPTPLPPSPSGSGPPSPVWVHIPHSHPTPYPTPQFDQCCLIPLTLPTPTMTLSFHSRFWT